MDRSKILKYFKLDQDVATASEGRFRLETGTELLDFLSQYGASPFGGVDPWIADALKDFLDSRPATMCQPFQGASVNRLKNRLLTLTGLEGGEVYLSQSGAETVEVAVKMARAATRKPYTIALDGAFHGKTAASVELTGNQEFADYFGVKSAFTRRLSVGSTEQLATDFEALTKDGQVNAIILEFLQGEGGMRAIDPDWIRKAAELARQAGILVIADEVQTGIGRTGNLFAFERYGIKPDIVVLSKALGGGLVPIGACIAAPDVCPSEFSVFQSSTFANNNFTCFVAERVLDRVDEAMLANVREVGEHLGARLDELVAAYPEIYSHASGEGLMRGLHLHPQTDPRSYLANFWWHSGLTAYAAASWLMQEQGIIVMPCFSRPSCLRVQPPLTASRGYIDKGVDALEQLAQLMRQPGGLPRIVAADSACRPAPSGDTKRGHPVPHRKTGTAAARFQFAINPLNADSWLTSPPREMASLDERGQARFEERAVELCSMLPKFSAECYRVPPFRLGGTEIEGRLFNINARARDIMEMSARDRKTMLNTLAASASAYQPDVFGLGAHTSILAQGGFLLRNDAPAVTAGSALTAFAAVRAVMSMPSPERPQHVGVIGANGSVGALLWQLLLACEEFDDISRVTLFANPNNPRALQELGKTMHRTVNDWHRSQEAAVNNPRRLARISEAYKAALSDLETGDANRNVTAFTRAVNEVLGPDAFRVEVGYDGAALQSVDRALVATNLAEGLDALDMLAPGARVYDLGYPRTVDTERMRAGGRDVVSTGLMACPEDWEFGTGNLVGLPPGVLLACFAETITLAATDVTAAPSPGVITTADAERIGALARRVGLWPTIVDNNGQIIHAPNRDVLAVSAEMN